MAEVNRGLFEIRAVVLDTDEIIHVPDVVAEGEKEALYASELKAILKDRDLSLHDVHLIVNEIGQVPPKEKVKSVKIIGQIGRTIVGRERKR